MATRRHRAGPSRLRRPRQRGVEAMLEFVHPEFEMETLPGIAAEPQIYRGHDGDPPLVRLLLRGDGRGQRSSRSATSSSSRPGPAALQDASDGPGQRDRGRSRRRGAIATAPRRAHVSAGVPAARKSRLQRRPAERRPPAGPTTRRRRRSGSRRPRLRARRPARPRRSPGRRLQRIAGSTSSKPARRGFAAAVGARLEDGALAPASGPSIRRTPSRSGSSRQASG